MLVYLSVPFLADQTFIPLHLSVDVYILSICFFNFAEISRRKY